MAILPTRALAVSMGSGPSGQKVSQQGARGYGVLRSKGDCAYGHTVDKIAPRNFAVHTEGFVFALKHGSSGLGSREWRGLWALEGREEDVVRAHAMHPCSLELQRDRAHAMRPYTTFHIF